MPGATPSHAIPRLADRSGAESLSLVHVVERKATGSTTRSNLYLSEQEMAEKAATILDALPASKTRTKR